MAQVGLGRIASQIGGQVSTTTLGTIPRADDRVGYHQWKVIGIGPTTALNSDRDMSEWHVIFTDTNFRSCNSTIEYGNELITLYVAITCKSTFSWGSYFGVEGVRQRSEVFFGKLDKIFVFNTTSSGQNHTRATVIILDVCNEIITGQGP